ncbi:S1 RNA-binding domain-containing protein [Oceanobacillus damuensis]|uniref:S1 RNA-binding domain-containing protein n=1 Tax=Oceanobacillus damuensis TaxID=937928 RepID=UPI000836A91E|nr:S1 RNA-binding domain-containing protein [Oceanobacillus damuensis]
MAEEMNSVLIEGFDPTKMLNQGMEKANEDWKQVYGAYQNQKILQAPITGIENFGAGENEKTCAIVSVGSIRGLIPMEFTGADNLRQLRGMTGKTVAFKVLNYDRETEIFTGSRLEALEQMAEITLRKVEEEDIIPAVIHHVGQHVLRADIGGIEVVIPIEDVRYGWIDNLQDEYNVGDVLKVKILSIDKEKKKVKVSSKATQENPWPNCTKRYQKGGEYVGVVSGVREYGVFINLEPGVDSLATHLKFQNVKKGDRVLIRVQNINVKEEQVRTRITRIL